jgi:hypothetical protein
MKVKLLLVFVIALALFLGFTAVHTQHLGERFTAERIPSEAVMPVPPPLYQLGKGYCELALDDGSPTYYFDGWNVGDRGAIYLDPADCGGGDIYPFRLDTAVAIFFDFAGMGSVEIRVSVHRALDGDPCNGPGEQLYLSPPITITTFHPNWVKIPFPHVVCLEEPFFLDIQYASGTPGLIPSLLMDPEPIDTCPLWVYYAPFGLWYNFNTFWLPPIPGEFLLRLIGETGVEGCKYSHLYGDANCDGMVNIADVVHLVNYLFIDGPAPCLLRLGDVNCDEAINIADVVHLVNYLFINGPEACIPLEILTVNATSPHLADSMDYSTVTIDATDSLGNPVIGADIGVTLFTGLDSKFPYETMEKAEGSYIALVPTTLAGVGRIKATDQESGVSATTEVEFLPGEVAHLIVVKPEEPRDFLPRETFKAIGVATDPYQNAVPPPFSNIIFDTDLGSVDSVTVDEHGDHHAYMTSYELGIATVIVTETNTLLQDSFEMVFPAVDLLMPPTGSYGPGDTLQVPVNVFIPDPAIDLGYYDFEISFDPSMLSFLGAEDWDVEDGFPPPFVEIIEPGLVRIFQWGVGDYSTDIAQLLFECLTPEGYSTINVDLWDHSPFSLTDPYNNPIFDIEIWDWLRFLKLFEVVPTQKPTKPQYLKFWVAPGTFGSQQEAWNKIAADAAKLARIFAQEVEKCCPKFQFYVVVNWLSESDWDSIDADGNDSLEEFDNQPGGTSSTNPTKEESTMLANHHIAGMVNAYYVPNLSDGSLGEQLEPGGSTDSGGVVVDGNDTADDVLTHEFAHLYGLTHKDSTGATVPKGNIMYPTDDSATTAAEKCKALSKWQCKIITQNDP